MTRNNYKQWQVVTVILFVLAPFVSQQPKAQAFDNSQIRQMLMNQPDFAAFQQFGFIEPKGGFGATSKVAKLGARFREEDEDRILIRELGKRTIKIYPKRREFAEISTEDEVKEDEDFATTPEGLAKRSDVVFKLLGTDKIGAYECQKVEATYKDDRLKDLKFIFCLAPTLRT